jgi:TonB family protein
MKIHKKAFGFFIIIWLPVFGFITEGLRQGVSASSQPQEWQRYTVEGEEFSVSLPVLPAMNTRKIIPMRSRKSRTERELGSYWNGVVYTVRSVENILGQSLDDFIATRRQALNNSTEISVNGIAGRQFEFIARELNGTVQFFETKNHLYEFAAVGAPGDDPRVKDFFASIILGGKRLGKEIQDGIGAVFSTDNAGEPEQMLSSKDVDRKALIVTKPEPSYTDSARQGKITGTVVLRAVLAANGGVKDIREVSGLPFGLTESAIKSAQQMRFVPAMKNGQFVSMWVQLEYHFNIY